MAELTQHTLAQVAEHNKRDSPWLVIHDKIYDVQKFLEEVRRLLSVEPATQVMSHPFVAIEWLPFDLLEDLDVFEVGNVRI